MRSGLLFIVFAIRVAVTRAAVAAAPTATIQLHALPGSTAMGSATVGASGKGTPVLLDPHGVAPGSSVRAHAFGNCTHFGASFGGIATARANSQRAVRTRRRALFHGMPVDYSTIADGGHVITVVSRSRVVACGVIPGMS
jgi:hypothetical protein